jgi:5-methylcytosine-specific restriction protein A
MPRNNWTRDELLLACALVVENDWRELRQGDPSVSELSDLLRSLPLSRESAIADHRFRSPGSVSHKTTDIATAHPDFQGTATRGGQPTRDVVMDFVRHPNEMMNAARALRAAMSSGELHSIPPQPDEPAGDEPTAREGRLLMRLALYRERDRGLRDRKLRQVRKLGRDLACEVCSLDFEGVYGQLGSGYIEVHHKLPLHISGNTETRLDDLALLCANCHRMCHRAFRGESWRTPDTLRAEMANRSA